jgi:hypothetical protein
MSQTFIIDGAEYEVERDGNVIAIFDMMELVIELQPANPQVARFKIITEEGDFGDLDLPDESIPQFVMYSGPLRTRHELGANPIEAFRQMTAIVLKTQAQNRQTH